jgi:hypothetical protein
MEYSLPAWLGGLVGSVAAVAIYVPVIRAFERHLRAQIGPKTLEQRAAFEERLSVARRVILGVDVAILATVGYWVGKFLGTLGAPHPQL